MGVCAYGVAMGVSRTCGATSAHYSRLCPCGPSSSSSLSLPPPTPGAMWQVMQGSAYCQLTNGGTCVTDGVGAHGNNERCYVRALTSLYATATDFQTERYYDMITIGGSTFMGTAGPANVQMAAGATISWYSDWSVTRGGFTICGTMTPLAIPAPPPPPPPSPPLSPALPLPSLAAGAMWQVMQGSTYCQLTNGGTCVTDGVGTHGNHERCTIRAVTSLYATATDFQTEICCDRISIGGSNFRGYAGPFNVPMAAGATLTWYTDSSVFCNRHATSLKPCSNPRL